jgi:hypothetical protein
MRAHAQDGNQPLDALFCTKSDSRLAEQFVSWGYEVWDGTKTSVRDSFPTRIEQHRIVNYQSCRGLEGWTVVCLGLDSHYELTKAIAKKEPLQELISAEEYSSRRAAAAALIPLTRAIKHLVIQLDGHGTLGSVLRELSTQFPDTVHWESSRD